MTFQRDPISGHDLNFEATELRLGLPRTTTVAGEEFDKTSAKCNKRSFPDMNQESKSTVNPNTTQSNQKKAEQSNKAQVVGWPPVRSYMKKCLETKKIEEDATTYIKVSMDGAPYLRKIDLKLYNAYEHLLKALEDMFNFKIGEYSEREGYSGSEFAPTYEDKDGDWMLVGDVPWNMFINSCKRLRIMKGSEARGYLGCGV
ncbi:auxin-responsive protein IAA4-like [Euphorbia lathyris]|uniref:auxin-responsive protein IAA4-like n=1 Tax=Euphorbia lathyris TaxID=212925 RepID=UPI0033136E10